MSPQPLGACILVFDTENRVLLGKRKNSYKAGWFGLPGGRLELGESLIACAQRGLLEETGLIVSQNALHCAGMVRDPQEGYDFIHWVFSYQLKDDEKVSLQEPDKCEAWEWFDLAELPQDLLLGHQRAVTVWQQYQKNNSLAIFDGIGGIFL